jgi:hypothetical protein
MKLFPFCLLFFCGSVCAQSATSSPNAQCFEDYQFLIDALKNTPSYKAQIKGDKRKAFQEFARSVEKDILQDESIEIHCRMYLQQVLYQVRDWHLLIGSSKEEDPDLLKKREQLIPGTDLSPAALREKATTSAVTDPLAGIYFSSDSSLTLSVYPKEDKQLAGVVLHSTDGRWEPGTIKFLIDKTGDRTSGYVYSTGREALYFEDHSPGRLLDRWGYRKAGDTPVFYRPEKKDQKHGWEDLGNGIAYLYLSTFKGSTANIRELRKLYEQLLPQLPRFKHLVIDIRDNGGGGQVCYNPFLEGLDKMSQAPQLHLMINRNTASAAEHFTLEMRSRGATIYGENTAGAINYRYPNKSKKNWPLYTPNFQYRLLLSVAKNPKKYRDLSSESTGITPDCSLRFQQDWLEQVLEKIQ